MSIDRGIQSAIFFYLSCAPCANVRYKKKRRREALQSRAERIALELEEGENGYRHPGEPSSTNPHWQTEIAAGPVLVSRGKKKNNGNRSASTSALKSGKNGDSASNVASSADLASRDGASDDEDDSRWNFRPYHRADEDLWSPSSNLDGSQYSGSLRRPERVLTADSGGSTSAHYHNVRNPQINDMHPATVTKVNSRDDIMWMMRPLPVAEVMNGKERASRSRSDSGGSRVSRSVGLSRQVSNRLMEQRRRAAGSATAMSRESSSRTSNGVNGQRDYGISEHDFAHPPPKEKRRQSPIQTGHGSSGDSEDTVLRRPDFAVTNPRAPRVASKPRLSTIASDSAVAASRHDPDSLRRFAHLEISRPTGHDDSSEMTVIRPRRSSMTESGKPAEAASLGVTQRTVFKSHHKHEDSDMSARPELFDSWYTADFEPSKWIHEHTKREVRERWSMDF